MCLLPASYLSPRSSARAMKLIPALAALGLAGTA
eukprot:COSAG01_NODE_33821_length_550_cov_0.653595_1_plen_33_part_01